MTGNMDKAVEALAKLPPGPWRIEPHASNPYNVHVVDAAGQNVITNCGRVFGEYLVAVTAAIPHLGATREEIVDTIIKYIRDDAKDRRVNMTFADANGLADAILRLPTVQGQAWRPTDHQFAVMRQFLELALDVHDAQNGEINPEKLPKNWSVQAKKMLASLPPSQPAEGE